MSAARSGKVLLAEDDAAVATVIQAALEGVGHRVKLVETRTARDDALGHDTYDLLVTDVIFPDGDGLETLSDALANGANCPAIVLSAHNTLDTALRASRHGAYEYLPKPFDLMELVQTAKTAMRTSRTRTVSPVPETEQDDYPLVGRAPAMQSLYRVIARLADSDLSVLVAGESGTGKDLVARTIHQTSRRAERPFVAINMAAIPRELIESELFGYEKGAFTGADAKKVGRFGQAEGGTLFLDEIGDMPIEVQTRLLRVLQSGEYSPVGGAAVERADVRIIAASNRSLPALIAEGKFREDLFYRLNVVPVTVPPLRERRGDIASLCRHFLAEAPKRKLPVKAITPAALRMIERQDWPGNVRELENFIFRMCVLTRGESIGISDIRSQFSTTGREDSANSHAVEKSVAEWLSHHDADDGELYSRVIALVEKPLFQHVLAETEGNQLQAARKLGINRNTLRKRLSRCGLTPDQG